MILCAGEALIDMLPRDLVEGGTGFSPVAGGATLNTSVALGRLGEDVAIFTGLSKDLFGARLLEAMAASNVTSRAAMSDRPTTLAFVTLVDGHAQYAFYDEGTAGRMLTEADLPDTSDCTAMLFGGISLVSEPAADVYAALSAQAGDAMVMLDPNIRPSFIVDETRYRARLDRMLAHADVVKLSDEDLDWLNGGDIGAILDAGAKVVCITEGAKGVTAHMTRGTVFAPAHKAEVVDTIGAGDTFNAGFLAGLSRAGILSKDGIAGATDDQLRGALDLGARAAAVTVSRAGANPPWASEL